MYSKNTTRSSQSLLFCRRNKLNSLRLSSQQRCSIHLIIFVALLWSNANRGHVFFALLTPGLDASAHQSGVEGQNQLPCPAPMLLLLKPRLQLPLCFKLLLAAPVLFFKQPQDFCRAAFSQVITQSVQTLGAAATHLQDLALGLVEPPCL